MERRCREWGIKEGWRKQSVETGEGLRSREEKQDLSGRYREQKKEEVGSQWPPTSTETCEHWKRCPLWVDELEKDVSQVCLCVKKKTPFFPEMATCQVTQLGEPGMGPTAASS